MLQLFPDRPVARSEGEAGYRAEHGERGYSGSGGGGNSGGQAAAGAGPATVALGDSGPRWRDRPCAQLRGSGIWGARSGRNAARSSAANSSGSSHAAKWPPRSASWK
ncbi:MAG: hypothetical protein JWP40_848 [Blastococcus sp.]|nr:hypothetical protein [Blastococcus sp.]